MYLTRHQSETGPRWALDDNFLPSRFNLGLLLELPGDRLPAVLQNLASGELASGDLLPPVEPEIEIWASGVTYLRSRDARVAEAQTSDIYAKAYGAERPELFFKATGSRSVGHGGSIRVRRDSPWNVPEPELVLVANRWQEIVGYCAGNDVSSRSIEAENPLYLPQAKIYLGSCALGPGIELCGPEGIPQLTVQLAITRAGERVYNGETSLLNMKRTPAELVDYLFREQVFPTGVYLLTGTGIVPPDEFSLQPGDRVTVRVGSLALENYVQN